MIPRATDIVPTSRPRAGERWLPALIGALYLLFPTWIAASHVVLLLIVVYAAAHADRTHLHAVFRRAPVLWVLCGLYLMVLLGAAYSPASWTDIFLHWQKYLRFVYPVALLMILADHPRLQEIALNAFMAGMGFIVVSAWLSIWFVLPWSASKVTGWGQNHTVIGDHITQSLMMAFFAVVAINRAAHASDRLRQVFWSVWALLAVIGVTHLSFGRTGLFVLLAGMLGWLIRNYGGRRLVVALMVVAGSLALAVWSSQPMKARLMQAVTEAKTAQENRVSSIGHRSYNYQITLQMIPAAPLLGHGTASFHLVFCEFMEDPTDCGRYAWHPHNQFLMMAAEHGLLGAGLYVLMILMLLEAARRSSNSSASALLYALTAMLVADSLVNSPFFSSRESQFFSYMMALVVSMNLRAAHTPGK